MLQPSFFSPEEPVGLAIPAVAALYASDKESVVSAGRGTLPDKEHSIEEWVRVSRQATGPAGHKPDQKVKDTFSLYLPTTPVHPN